MGNFLKNLFTLRNLLSGVIGIAMGFFSFALLKLVHNNTFQDIGIFIGVGLGFILVLFVLGFVLNKTLFKDED